MAAVAASARSAPGKYIIYITNTEDTSALYYYDFTRTVAIVLICTADLLIYASILSHLYSIDHEKHMALHFGNIDTENKMLTIVLTVGIWISQTVSVILTILTII